MHDGKKTKPPKWADHFLEWWCSPQFIEEVQGDLHEAFHRRCNEKGVPRARLLFIADVLRSISFRTTGNPFHSKTKSGVMLRNNLKISLRVFSRNKAYTLINVVSLTSALAISMLILTYVWFELSFEQNNALADRVVRITMDYLSGETLTDQDAEMYHPAGPAITETFPEVIGFTRATLLRGGTVKVGNEYFRESEVYMVDSSYFRLLGHPLIKGKAETIFSLPYEAVLTESVALKYFSTLDVIGESIRVTPFTQDFKVTGIVHDSPANTHLPFQMLLSYPTIHAAFGDEGYGWDNNNSYTYLLLAPNTQPDHLQT
jgi:putative ABC transport system permease protein